MILYRGKEVAVGFLSPEIRFSITSGACGAYIMDTIHRVPNFTLVQKTKHILLGPLLFLLIET